MLNKFHENDLAPILPENNEKSPSKESSIIDDYANPNPNTEMPSYIDPDD